jgi:hypothetical protein
MAESIGILGAGITSLATAYVLSSKYKVTIVARDLPGDLGLDWASPWSVIARRLISSTFIQSLIIEQGRCSFPPSEDPKQAVAGHASSLLPVLLGTRSR